MNIMLKNKALLLLAILSASFVILAVVGGIRTYSPVPFWDMWDGYLGFFLHAQQGDPSIWWSQHNEHRIFLSRLLFWIDISFFKGLSIFLIFFNFLLGGLISFCFLHILKKGLPNNDQRLLRLCSSLFIIALVFSWTQIDNYSWGFQSQFFLAYLLPLIGFYSLYLSSAKTTNSRSTFFFACSAGIASAATMANGVVALPLMVALALFLKLKWKKIVFLFLLSGIVLFAYFYNYASVPYHTSLTESLFQHPFNFGKFILMFFGSPFFYMSGSKIIGLIAGIFFVSSSIYFLFSFFQKNKSSSIQLSLFAFLIYIAGSAFGIAGARLGISSPMESRYMTPVLMSWSILLILYMLNTQKAVQHRIIPFLVLALMLLFPSQIRAVKQDTKLFEREIAALALKMQIKDKKQISCIFPHPSVIDIARKAAEKNLSIFDTPRFKMIDRFLKKIDMTYVTAEQCLGHLDEISLIEDEPGFVKIKGWIFEPKTQNVPSVIRILDKDQKIIGYAFTGCVRNDAKKAISSKALHSGFSGYMLAEYADQEVILKGLDPDCYLTASVQ